MRTEVKNHSTITLQASSTGPSSTPDLLCFSHLRWHFVTQRPQHLMRRAAARQRVFFWEEPLWHDPGSIPGADAGAVAHLGILREEPTLWVLQPHLVHGTDPVQAQRELLQQLFERFGIQRFLSWYYTPMSLTFSSHLQPMATVYDCMDELTGFLGAPPELATRERDLLDRADVVFTGGISLYEAKRTQHVNVHAMPSSIDLPHFAQAKSGALVDPADQAAIAHPRAGFYGVIDERLDIELLRETASLRPEVQFILLGPVVKIDPASLPQAANLHYLGGKSYNDLPAYLAHWDVALLPFALNAATRFISPTKTPEYLAAGKPVVSTPILDVMRGYGEFHLVSIASSATEFADAIDASLQPQPHAWHQAVESKLAQSSWDSTWASMWHQIERAAGLSCALPIAETPPARTSASYKPAPALAPLDAASLRQILHPAPTRTKNKQHYDYLVVGAGFAGSVLAERLASQLGKRVLVVDKRNHLAGNAYDHNNADGILIHQYGPHIFHTNSDNVVAYLSQFTEWRPYEHRVLSSIDGKLLPIPINLDTINRLYDLSLDSDGMKHFLDQRRVPCDNIRTSEDLVVSRVGRDLYEKFFRNYTIKQWGLDPAQLDSGVAGRIPVRFDRDDRYFSDTFQAMPRHGYTAMFERILDHPLITWKPGVAYTDVARVYPDARIIFTGPIDEFFGFRFGKLPYRSLEFKHETHDREFFQTAPVVNYPNDHAYTRITEFKYLTGQTHARTSIVYEFPTGQGDPYYPIPRPENAAIAARYRELAQQQNDVHFCGRLANYQYLNMDQVVAQALTLFREIAGQDRSRKIPALAAHLHPPALTAHARDAAAEATPGASSI